MTAPSGRLRADMSRILILQPMISMTALFMKHDERQMGTDDQVAATNGREVTIWPRFHAYREEERRGILLHEYLHAAFAHPARAVKLKRRHAGTFRMDVLNVGADAIINASITRAFSSERGPKSIISLPQDAINLERIVAQACSVVALTGVDVDVNRLAKVEKLTLEWIYDALMKLLEAAEQCQETNRQESSDGKESEGGGKDKPAAKSPGKDDQDQEPGDGDEPETPEQRVEKSHRANLQRFTDQFKRPQDIEIDGFCDMTSGEIDEVIREAGEKLRNAIKSHGSGRSNVIEHLDGDIPRVNTPWESSFRSITQRHLARQRVRRPVRPGRRVMTQEAMGLKSIVWSAARRRPTVPLVVIAIDSSGSVDANEYRRYLAELQAMKRRTNARLVAVVADTTIHSVTEIDDIKQITGVEFEGRGGTDFRPAIALAEEMEADLLVYLTDLMGTFPNDKPAMPVLWTTTLEDVPNGYQPPFGRVLHVG